MGPKILIIPQVGVAVQSGGDYRNSTVLESASYTKTGSPS